MQTTTETTFKPVPITPLQREQLKQVLGARRFYNYCGNRIYSTNDPDVCYKSRGYKVIYRIDREPERGEILSSKLPPSVFFFIETGEDLYSNDCYDIKSMD